jgi:hypothetical protein
MSPINHSLWPVGRPGFTALATGILFSSSSKISALAIRHFTNIAASGLTLLGRGERSIQMLDALPNYVAQVAGVTGLMYGMMGREEIGLQKMGITCITGVYGMFGYSVAGIEGAAFAATAGLLGQAAGMAMGKFAREVIELFPDPIDDEERVDSRSLIIGLGFGMGSMMYRLIESHRATGMAPTNADMEGSTISALAAGILTMVLDETY